MSKRLFNLRHVPADEADDVRELLEREGFEWYETPPSPFGISHGALWLKDAAQYERAKGLLDAYQQQRGERAREEQTAARREGRAETFVTLMRTRPLFVIINLGAILFIVALTLALPFLLLR